MVNHMSAAIIHQPNLTQGQLSMQTACGDLHLMLAVSNGASTVCEGPHLVRGGHERHGLDFTMAHSHARHDFVWPLPPRRPCSSAVLSVTNQIESKA